MLYRVIVRLSAGPWSHQTRQRRDIGRSRYIRIGMLMYWMAGIISASENEGLVFCGRRPSEYDVSDYPTMYIKYVYNMHTMNTMIRLHVSTRHFIKLQYFTRQ